MAWRKARQMQRKANVMTKDNSKAQDSTNEGAPVEAPSTGVGVEALAQAVGASPKDVRRWLRAQTREALGAEGASEALPGKGRRYAFTSQDVEALARAYSTSKAGAKGTRAPASAIIAAMAAPVE